jgi:hypothetical protein
VLIRSTTLGKEQQQRCRWDPNLGKPNLSTKEEMKNKLDGFSGGRRLLMNLENWKSFISDHMKPGPGWWIRIYTKKKEIQLIRIHNTALKDHGCFREKQTEVRQTWLTKERNLAMVFSLSQTISRAVSFSLASSRMRACCSSSSSRSSSSTSL